MTSNFVFSLMYSVASIQASGWGGSSLGAGLAATSMVVLSFDAVSESLLLKSGQVRSSKFSIRAG